MLEGTRIRLVAPRKEFIPTFTKWMNDREVLQYLLMYKPLTLETEEQWFDQMITHENSLLFSILTLPSPENENETLIGNVSIDIDHRNGVGSLGIIIGEKKYWGQGYGTEALRLLIAYAFDTLNLQRIEIEVFSSNPRALVCYKKVGFTEEGRKRRRYYVRGQYIDTIQLGLLKEEFRP
ncbi:MAG: N-acetyltransferase [Promethearchaeota archaeon]|nr:MAG: N-acetyltransferase [Candidatus Lokiarchaeota archaeon]